MKSRVRITFDPPDAPLQTYPLEDFIEVDVRTKKKNALRNEAPAVLVYCWDRPQDALTEER